MLFLVFSLVSTIQNLINTWYNHTTTTTIWIFLNFCENLSLSLSQTLALSKISLGIFRRMKPKTNRLFPKIPSLLHAIGILVAFPFATWRNLVREIDAICSHSETRSYFFFTHHYTQWMMISTRQSNFHFFLTKLEFLNFSKIFYILKFLSTSSSSHFENWKFEKMSLLSPKHLEFYAEDTMVTIIPKFSTKRLSQIPQSRENRRVTFHSAMFLPFFKFFFIKLKRCSGSIRWQCIWNESWSVIQTPSWMDPDRPSERVEEKRENSFSSDILEHYAEISSALGSSIGDDILNENAQRMRLLFEDIRHTRQAKIRQGIKQVMNNAKNGSPPHVIKITKAEVWRSNHERCS